MLKAENISIVFNNAYLIKRKSFYLKDNEIVLLKGDNGTGKTTLIKALAGIKSIDAGELEYFDQNQSISQKEFQANLGLCISNQFLCLDMTLEENLKLYYSSFDSDIYVQDLLSQLSLEHKLKHVLKNFSKGELQKSALCRALLHNPNCVFLDEPFEGLDQKSQEFLKQWIEQHRSKKTIVLCTHNSVFPESDYDQVWDLNS